MVHKGEGKGRVKKLSTLWIFSGLSKYKVFFLHLEDAVDDYEDDEDDITDLTDPMESLRAKLGQVSRPPQKFNVLEKFRYRSDKMIVRETFLLEDKVIER